MCDNVATLFVNGAAVYGPLNWAAAATISATLQVHTF
jgi:hypothetical protein